MHDNDTDMKLLAIRDQLAALMGQIDDCSKDPASRESKDQLLCVARELHSTADEVAWLVARIKK